MSISFHRRDNGFTRICGHRGFSLHYPENTIVAFEATRDAGGTSCEIDLVLSRDGEVIVLHDMTLDRTTTGFGYAGDHDWAQIQMLDAGIKTGAQFAGVRVPTFRETVLWAKANGIGLDAELKDDDRAALLAQRVIEVLRETEGFGHVRVISFDHKALAAIRKRDERLRTQAILHARHADVVHVLQACGAESASIELMMFDEEDAEAMHKAGLCNRVHLPRPAKLAIGWSYGRDMLPKLRSWIRGGLIDVISGDDVLFLRRLVESAGEEA
ncbi:glycerophosphodiester phosphodiesterase family protein [Bosea sp. BK604]|uniref:glycerophosphodiester phosphodiesterase n=1 Tax=Bosea sp. BK604 TaxID=2512180 RepID=UPI0010531797|nr:glycerophosphodiester phosphodiesterase family protein [Bosea sp. BK604]TCR64592.1 glycerophosphoryl diester phosphodiesterase [Bosea sp. BK604]